MVSRTNRMRYYKSINYNVVYTLLDNDLLAIFSLVFFLY